jgi:competence protein ComFB
MDYLKNTLEEVIIKEVEDAFRANPSVCGCLQCRKDVTVFVLNNVKPRYIISTRGMLHESTNLEESGKVIDEIRGLIPEGMQRVSEHKRPNFDHMDDEGQLIDIIGKTERFTMTPDYHFNYPFFIGSVEDADSREKLSGVEVSLLVNNELVPGWDANWPNPYITSEKSGGKFAFWPRALGAPEPDKASNREFSFLLRLKLDGYAATEFPFQILMESQKYIINFIRQDYTKDLGVIRMQKG